MRVKGRVDSGRGGRTLSSSSLNDVDWGMGRFRYKFIREQKKRGSEVAVV